MDVCGWFNVNSSIGWNITLEYAISASAVAQGWASYLVSFLTSLGVEVPKILYDYHLFFVFTFRYVVFLLLILVLWLLLLLYFVVYCCSLV